MKSKAATPEAYLAELPEDRREAVQKLRETVRANLPEGFEEMMNYGMIGYVVPHSLYPAGYHCDKKQPLPFINLGSQKNFVALYHMGIYANNALMNWFTEAYKNQVKTKLDMGKSCIRFKNLKTIPYGLIGELCSRMTVLEWIAFYENALGRNQKNN